jgi:predicted GNAT family N-acyltransferase
MRCDMLIQGKLLGYGDDLSEVKGIRRKVFVEEYGVYEDVEFDDLDDTAMHAIIYEEAQDWRSESLVVKKVPVATGRIIYDGTVCIIDNVAVLKEYRGMKYGDFTVKMLLSKAFTSGINEVMTKTFFDSQDFFRTIGFDKFNEGYFEKGIRYVDMIIKQSDLIKLCSKCN